MSATGNPKEPEAIHENLKKRMDCFVALRAPRNDGAVWGEIDVANPEFRLKGSVKQISPKDQ